MTGFASDIGRVRPRRFQPRVGCRGKTFGDVLVALRTSLRSYERRARNIWRRHDHSSDADTGNQDRGAEQSGQNGQPLWVTEPRQAGPAFRWDGVGFGFHKMACVSVFRCEFSIHVFGIDRNPRWDSRCTFIGIS